MDKKSETIEVFNDSSPTNSFIKSLMTFRPCLTASLAFLLSATGTYYQ
jgi:hypothetical protein